MKERQRRYGHGKWPRNQLYAIVASYRGMGRDPDWVAARIGVGPRMVHQIYDYIEWSEEVDLLARLEKAEAENANE